MSPINFHNLTSVTSPRSIHGIYPYRGKISSVEAKLVVEQLPRTSKLLDPFCGSGTIIYEGLYHGMSVIGVDNNPLAYWLSKGKIDSLVKPLESFQQEFEKISSKAIKNKSARTMPIKASKHFHEKTASEIMQVIEYFDDMSDYLKAVLLGSIALAARGCNHYKWTSSTVGKDINPKNYISFFDKFAQKVKKHHAGKVINQPNVELYMKDSRKLTEFIKSNSIDFVFTSPPYFDGLDYTAYYGKIIYEILGSDRAGIKDGLIQSVKSYEADMKLVLDEIIKVTKKDAQIMFVVGDKKIGNEIINGGEFFSNLLHHKPNQIIEREYTLSSSQVFDKLNNTKRKEQVVVWDKSTW